MRAGGRPKRGRGAMAMEGDRQDAGGIGLDEALGGQIEGALQRQFAEQASGEDAERKRYEVHHGAISPLLAYGAAEATASRAFC